MRETKAAAARTGRTLTAVVEDALRASLLARRLPAANAPPAAKLPTFRGDGGLMPGVDLEDNAALRDLLEEDQPLAQRR